jgi:carbon storage regulator
MLYLMRKQDESIIINNNIELKVIEIKGKSVKLGFQFPQGASVLRKELFDKIMAENQAASSQVVDASIFASSPKLTLGKGKPLNPSSAPAQTAAAEDTSA